MWEAFIVLSSGFLVGGATVWLLGGLISWRLSRRCTSLEMAVGDLQQRVSSFKGREMSEKRWAKKDQETLEMAQILQNPPPSRRRYDNDPLGEL